MAMLRKLNDGDLEETAKRLFEAVVSHSKSRVINRPRMNRSRSKPELDPKNMSFYGRSRSMVDIPIMESPYQTEQLEDIQVQLQNIRAHFEIG